MRFWSNLLGYQMVWFCAVIGAGRGYAWPGVVAALAFVAWQWASSEDRARDARVLLVALVCGCALDGALAASGLLRYAAAWTGAAFAPAWILALWAAFAMTLPVSLAFLQRSVWLAAAFGAIGGPLAYWGASRGFDAVAFDSPWRASAVLAAGWGASMAILAHVASGVRRAHVTDETKR